jgi:hypothetical protein
MLLLGKDPRRGKGSEPAEDEEDIRLLEQIRALGVSGASFAEIEPLIRLYRARRTKRLVVQALRNLCSRKRGL